MDNDINNFCENILPYLNDYQDNLNHVISLMIRDIRTNDLIYCNNNKKWYEYDLYKKKWKDFDFNKIMNQISTFYKFFDENLKNYVDSSKLNDNNKLYLFRLIKNIVIFIKNKLYDKKNIYKDCCNLFSIWKLV